MKKKILLIAFLIFLEIPQENKKELNSIDKTTPTHFSFLEQDHQTTLLEPGRSLFYLKLASK